ncbi:hypothetical protein EI77_03059 [Prosthecobacter fusiformis]|uniref:DUF4337 domain-containing protein n=1 Tax=Prosthecobacter fusiformis TaxID=48464 RepID=A0A4R7RWP4_9BACT|nr:hypothetical protein [Prosthecobacter fusiformis]TDU69406.1 hypothetical protein EI77_03059 [Prosthecobacter fusiformis]
MRAFAVTLFIIGNLIFLTQLGKDVHQLIWGMETSMFDEFEPEKISARAETNTAALLEEFRKADAEIKVLERSKTSDETYQVRKENESLYNTRNEARVELLARESKSAELRDLWVFSGYGIFLIAVGGILSRKAVTWPGLAVLVSGFSILEYWASPPFFEGAGTEFRTLLWNKTFLTFFALFALYACAVMFDRKLPIKR